MGMPVVVAAEVAVELVVVVAVVVVVSSVTSHTLFFQRTHPLAELSSAVVVQVFQYSYPSLERWSLSLSYNAFGLPRSTNAACTSITVSGTGLLMHRLRACQRSKKSWRHTVDTSPTTMWLESSCTRCNDFIDNHLKIPECPYHILPPKVVLTAYDDDLFRFVGC